jgi:hypothetical protein
MTEAYDRHELTTYDRHFFCEIDYYVVPYNQIALGPLL